MAAIELEGLSKHYGDVRANDDVTFSVERGEIFGYLGPNGAGKTTTIRTLLGLLSPTSGTGRLLGHDVTNEAELIEAKRKLGYLPDTPSFDETATGREILELHASITGDERSDDLLELFDPPLDRLVREYSHGNVRKLGLVTTFMHEPELVILDEPTSGLDPLMQHRFAEFLRRERERGVTVFFSSHVLGEVRRLCDRVGIIRNGRLVAVEPVESLLDRSGKVVRVRAVEGIPIETFAFDGVHDLEATTNRLDGQRDDVDGGDSEATITECTFTFTGDVNALLERVREYPLQDLSIEEAPLEDVFMRFYGEEAEGASEGANAEQHSANSGVSDDA
ncbi:ABC-2 type transport system ATP-binding protein [Natronorubrum sediminis]|uniref:ABC-2 type transport system ATP-binding protein n=1 Tax=Natronorubrum sediminis TaxID=640943 RepID=A0A1H6G144_9EURY|nr:ABC transporter ATP-binding protein [Natronorubrum sediminis]SEH16178.1 ABC-2 type transport system ATP-binding protein [Natronorubrum sediminis]